MSRHARRSVPTTRLGALPRVLVAVLAGLAVGLAGTCAALALRPDGSASGPAPVAAAPSDPATPDMMPGPGRVEGPADVLRQWDAARSAAWRAGDVGRLGALYTPGSRAGARDVAMLEAWVERGVRVTAMRTEVLRLRTLHDDGDRLVLRVTDRVVDLAAAGVDLPRDTPTTRTLTLQRRAGEWRVASVAAV